MRTNEKSSGRFYEKALRNMDIYRRKEVRRRRRKNNRKETQIKALLRCKNGKIAEERKCNRLTTAPNTVWKNTVAIPMAPW